MLYQSHLFPDYEIGRREMVRYCRRCHRRLKRAKWMKIGYGCVCYKKTFSNSAR